MCALQEAARVPGNVESPLRRRRDRRKCRFRNKNERHCRRKINIWGVRESERSCCCAKEMNKAQCSIEKKIRNVGTFYITFRTAAATAALGQVKIMASATETAYGSGDSKLNKNLKISNISAFVFFIFYKNDVSKITWCSLTPACMIV